MNGCTQSIFFKNRCLKLTLNESRVKVLWQEQTCILQWQLFCIGKCIVRSSVPVLHGGQYGFQLSHCNGIMPMKCLSLWQNYNMHVWYNVVSVLRLWIKIYIKPSHGFQNFWSSNALHIKQFWIKSWIPLPSLQCLMQVMHFVSVLEIFMSCYMFHICPCNA